MTPLLSFGRAGEALLWERDAELLAGLCKNSDLGGKEHFAASLFLPEQTPTFV